MYAKINKKGRPTIIETLDKSLDIESDEFVGKTLGNNIKENVKFIYP